MSDFKPTLFPHRRELLEVLYGRGAVKKGGKMEDGAVLLEKNGKYYLCRESSIINCAVCSEECPLNRNPSIKEG